MQQFIGYIRVSTKSQGDSGLGLEAQEKALAEHVRKGGKLLKTYREVESGGDDDRPELAKALLHVKRSGATLLVAKLDRLSRSVAFTSALMESKVPFVCCDMPDANEFTIHIFAALARQERKDISRRTKAALDALKDRGVKLGSARPDHWQGLVNCPACKGKGEVEGEPCPKCGGSGKGTETREQRRLDGIARGRVKGFAVRQANAEKMHRELCPVVIAYRTEGMTLAAIAARLNDEGWLTPRRRQWNEVYVHRFLKQCEQTGRERTSARV